MTSVMQVNHSVAQSLALRCIKIIYTPPTAWPFSVLASIMESDGESIRDASSLTEPDPARLQRSRKAGFYRFGRAHP
jgi:hypothetical protein